MLDRAAVPAHRVGPVPDGVDPGLQVVGSAVTGGLRDGGTRQKGEERGERERSSSGHVHGPGRLARRARRSTSAERALRRTAASRSRRANRGAGMGRVDPARLRGADIVRGPGERPSILHGRRDPGPFPAKRPPAPSHAPSRPRPPISRAFLDRLREAGELVEIEAEVDPRLEMAEVHRRVIAADGPAILFKRPKGAAFPAVTNLFGSAERVRLAFGDRPEELVERIARLPEEALPPTPSKLWAQRDLALSLARVGLKRGRRGPVTRVVERDPDLSRLPALTTWSRDGGPFVTLPSS